MADKVKVLVVGQTPPPHHGQAIMIEKLLAGRFRRLELHHVRMSFSESIDDVGRARAGKVLHLFGLIRQIIGARNQHRPEILYFPPAGPNRIPVYRDLALLLATRRLFAHTAFHFHAGGLTEIGSRLTAPERMLFRLAYGRPDLAILLSELNPPDGERLGAKQTRVIPYGIEDVFTDHAGERRPGKTPRILFVGALLESKGVMVLLEACRLLAAAGSRFEVRLVGGFPSRVFADRVRRFVEESGLGDRVSFPGVLTGADKWRAFAEADLFCFPTHYESETLGVVVLEAMQFGLPVVATRWRGIPSLISDGESGHLVPTEDPPALASCLGPLLQDRDRRCRLGEAARSRFEAEFTVDRWYSRMEEALLSVVGQVPSPRLEIGSGEL